MTEAIGNIKRHLDPASLIRREIADSPAGAIPFVRFMERALYAPGCGYYERPQQAVGRRGDFFTSVSVGGLFGELLAARFAVWMEPARLDRVQWVEAGAHEGRLAEDLLTAWSRRRPPGPPELDYWIIEPSPAREASQRQRLQAFGDRVRWFHSFGEIPGDGIRGVIVSNELLDAMPVRRLGWDARARRWFEWGVCLQNDSFAWTRLEAALTTGDAGPALPLAADLLAVLPDGFTIETSPDAARWWSGAAKALRQGRLMTFDYGHREGGHFRPERSLGTLRAYRGHTVSADVLIDPGEQDITAHVDFEAIRRTGEGEGLETDRLCTQEQFLMEAAALLESNPPPGFEWTPERRRQLLTLVHPEHLGRTFKVLVQRR